MKVLAVIVISILVIQAVFGDVVIRLKHQSSGKVVLWTYKFGPHNMRVDHPIAPWGDGSMITSRETNEVILLLHDVRVYAKLPVNPEELKAKGTNSTPLKWVETGETETIGNHTGRIYLGTNAETHMAQKCWMTTDLPNYKNIQAVLKKASRNQEPYHLFPVMLNPPPGIAIKSETRFGDGTGMTVTLISAQDETVDSSEYEVPKGYHDRSIDFSKWMLQEKQ
jgi:hypothetical protein